MAELAVNVVMLANTADGGFYEMTREAIYSLHRSEELVHFEVVVVESNKHDWEPCYPHALTVRCPLPFNYNQALNTGLGFTNPHAPYTVLANNDLLFSENWLRDIVVAMRSKDLDSASPLAPGWHCHEGLNENEVSFGYRTSFEFCGWCLVWKTESLEKLLPLDERYAFEWQDVDLAKRAQALGMRHALVHNSKVKHLLNQSHRLIPAERHDEMFEAGKRLYFSQ